MNRRVWVWVSSCVLAVAAGCGSGEPPPLDIAAIHFETDALPAGGAGELYSTVVKVTTSGGAPLPDRFEIVSGTVAPGIEVVRDREDIDGDGLPDENGAFTGDLRLVGHPREPGTFQFEVKAVSTGSQPDDPALSDTVTLTLNIASGAINIITPTAEEGTADPSVPAFNETINYVNPADPQAFFSFSFLIAGGSGDNSAAVYMPRELELSTFDAAVVDPANPVDGTYDLDEGASSGDKQLPDFSDGGVFMLQAGMGKVQIGGFQSPRGPVGFITRHGAPPGVAGYDPDWFQRPTVPQNSRRDFADTQGLAGGDNTLGTPQPVRFSDYFDAAYEGTHDSFTAPPGSGLQRRKYPFTADQYGNAFFLPFSAGVDLTPLRYRIIAEAIDRRGTASRLDDVIVRKAFIVQVRIPAIRIDSVVLPDGQAGVDYNEVVAASGGVPPLSYELEVVDGDADGEATVGDPLTKDLFGIELDPVTGQFNGVPRASSAANGGLDLTVRVFAAVMDPVQAGSSRVPTGTAGEYDGTILPGGGAGRHKTFTVYYAPPTAPAIATSSLAAGIDGVAYPGDRVTGMGGVPLLAPYPVGFPGTYPSSTARRAYEFSASHTKDPSYPGEVGQPGTTPLPNALQFEGDASVATNGEITGVPFDRGFHTISFTGEDFYVGDAAVPNATGFRQSFAKDLNLSISPDTAVYTRGVAGAMPSGLLDGAAQMGEARMAPLFAAHGFFTAATGSTPQRLVSLPSQMDFLPVMLANGGSDAHVDKSIPSVSGYWPAESNKNDRWEYYSTGNQSPYQGWKHLQQEQTWIQTPTAQHHRVLLWAETKLKRYNGPWGTSTQSTNGRYQLVDASTGKRRGVMVLDPLSGRYRIPAVLTNSNPAHGTQFGTEDVWGTSGNAITSSSNSNSQAYRWGYVYGGSYNRYYTYPSYTEGDREARLGGGGSFIEAYTRFSNGSSAQGRTSSTVAVSADGLWGATALPGGNGPKILLWRNDGQAIPAAILAQAHVTGLSGVDDTGATLVNSACIVDVSAYGADQRYLLPDSLMFVRDGLLFLMEKRLDFIHGVSLVDGHLSAKDVNDRVALSAAQGTGPSASATRGQPVPDQDFVHGMKRVGPSSVQFSFAGNQPAAGEEGPDKLAFIAGGLRNINPMVEAYAVVNSQSNRSYYTMSNDTVRKGYGQGITGNKSVLFLEVSTGASGLDLGDAGTTVKDLSGHESRIYGDFLTPGRLGEELDFVAVSPDGKYVAAVRNVGTGVYTTTYYSRNPTFSSVSTSVTTSTSYYQAADDILLFSTEGADLDTASGTQTVLYLGKGVMGSSTNVPDSIDYVSAEAYLNAYSRRIYGVQFSPDSKSLIFVYQGDNSRNPKYFGSAYQYTMNATSRSTTYHAAAKRISVRFQFRTSADGPITFGSSPASFLSNMLSGLSGVGGVGDTAPPFTTAGGDQQFFATFRSPNGNFLYYISDPYSGRNHMVGFNISDSTINGHAPFEPFSPHGSSVGFEQFDCNAWNFENRFAAVPGGVVLPESGRDGDGIVFVIASDATAGATSATDLEVYAFDSNIGGNLVSLTSAVTDGTANAINGLTVSADGNVLVGQRAQTTADSGNTRVQLCGDTDLFAVTNVHAVLAGAAPNAFLVSEGASHGASVAFVGEGTAAGAQAVFFTRADAGGNSTWDDRQLFSAALTPNAVPTAIDEMRSYYIVLAGKRKLDDDPTTSD